MPIEVPFLTGSKKKVVKEFNPRLFGAYSHVGQRKEQQDDFVVAHTPSANHPSLLAIFDGMGGMENGRQASEAAAITTLAHLTKILEKRSERKLHKAVLDALAEAYAAVIKNAGMNSGTTATVVPIIDGKAYPVHLGDSRAYKFEPQKKKLALPQLLTVLTPDRRIATHTVTSYLGMGSAYGPDVVKPMKISRGGGLLVCTDGVWEKAEPEKIVEILSSKATAQQMAQQIVEHALQKGSRDNCTALVYLNRRIKKK